MDLIQSHRFPNGVEGEAFHWLQGMQDQTLILPSFQWFAKGAHGLDWVLYARCWAQFLIATIINKENKQFPSPRKKYAFLDVRRQIFRNQWPYLKNWKTNLPLSPTKLIFYRTLWRNSKVTNSDTGFIINFSSTDWCMSFFFKAKCWFVAN